MHCTFADLGSNKVSSSSSSSSSSWCHGWRGKRSNGCWTRLVCFDGEKWYGGEEDEVIVPHRPKQRACKSD